MTIKKLKYHVNGEWLESKSGKYMDCFDPSSGEVIAQTPQCTADEVDLRWKLPGRLSRLGRIFRRTSVCRYSFA